MQMLQRGAQRRFMLGLGSEVQLRCLCEATLGLGAPLRALELVELDRLGLEAREGLAPLVVEDRSALRLAARHPRSLLGEHRLGGLVVLVGEGALTTSLHISSVTADGFLILADSLELRLAHELRRAQRSPKLGLAQCTFDGLFPRLARSDVEQRLAPMGLSVASQSGCLEPCLDLRDLLLVEQAELLRARRGRCLGHAPRRRRLRRLLRAQQALRLRRLVLEQLELLGAHAQLHLGGGLGALNLLLERRHGARVLALASLHSEPQPLRTRIHPLEPRRLERQRGLCRLLLELGAALRQLLPACLLGQSKRSLTRVPLLQPRRLDALLLLERRRERPLARQLCL
eukprot:jgi/Chrpa1/17812/Chrysochromulina_OHIO_Genome00008920-RA